MNVKIRLLFILFILNYSLSTAVAQITGNIVDARTGESIPFASVQYKGHDIGVVSNLEGRYQIARHNGWTLTFSAVGYVSVMVMVDANLKSPCDIQLMPDNKMLKEVTVKSKRERASSTYDPAWAT